MLFLKKQLPVRRGRKKEAKKMDARSFVRGKVGEEERSWCSGSFHFSSRTLEPLTSPVLSFPPLRLLHSTATTTTTERPLTSPCLSFLFPAQKLMMMISLFPHPELRTRGAKRGRRREGPSSRFLLFVWVTRKEHPTHFFSPASLNGDDFSTH